MRLRRFGLVENKLPHMDEAFAADDNFHGINKLFPMLKKSGYFINKNNQEKTTIFP